MYKCKYCGREFERSVQLGGHVCGCKLSPKYKTICAARIERNNVIPREFVCPKCGKHFTLVLSESKFKSGRYPKFCSRACANSRGEYSEERKLKISQGIRQHLIDIGYQYVDKREARARNKSNKPRKPRKPRLRKVLTVTKVCECCGKEFIVPANHRNRKYCCKECMIQTRHNKLSEAGKKSALVQGENRRSKNEKMFCDLCEQLFEHVDHNQSIFNGWDADILIYDLKIAVLWNGVWHYKKITKQHSVEQVQNRDRIKIKEIEQAGWVPYIIEDKGSYNPDFVKNEFNKFIEVLQLDNAINPDYEIQS